MKNIWLLTLSMIPGFLAAEQSWPQWYFDTARRGIGQSLTAITNTLSTAKNVGSKTISFVKRIDSADVTVGAMTYFGFREISKKCKAVSMKSSMDLVKNSISGNYNVGRMIGLSIGRSSLKIGAKSALVGFMYHTLTDHTYSKWAEKQKKKS